MQNHRAPACNKKMEPCGKGRYYAIEGQKSHRRKKRDGGTFALERILKIGPILAESRFVLIVVHVYIILAGLFIWPGAAREDFNLADGTHADLDTYYTILYVIQPGIVNPGRAGRSVTTDNMPAPSSASRAPS